MTSAKSEVSAGRSNAEVSDGSAIAARRPASASSTSPRCTRSSTSVIVRSPVLVSVPVIVRVDADAWTTRGVSASTSTRSLLDCAAACVGSGAAARVANAAATAAVPRRRRVVTWALHAGTGPGRDRR
ncbi:hypothetical protein ACFQV2_38650 [Actinokineospora soli]|uniref:Uncharacterized protein n=1 Tax=Actinokineospora soli TaxID=1048753 RepID=A0ABW2U0Z7_9PSEU